MFPEDFDGVIAGAPAWWTVSLVLTIPPIFACPLLLYYTNSSPQSHQQIWQFWLGYVNYISNISEIPVSMFDTIGKEVLKQCDGQDGLVDVSIV